VLALGSWDRRVTEGSLFLTMVTKSGVVPARRLRGIPLESPSTAQSAMNGTGLAAAPQWYLAYLMYLHLLYLFYAVSLLSQLHRRTDHRTVIHGVFCC
jgi:hypothetical protein